MATSHQSSTGSEYSDDMVQQANDLYWHSGASVNRLAQELELSKGTLYELLTPYPAGLPCPIDQGELVYSNRTARDKGFVVCLSCGLEEEEDRVRAQLEREGYPPELHGPAASPAAPNRRLEKVILGSALVGMAAGVALASLFRRR